MCSVYIIAPAHSHTHTCVNINFGLRDIYICMDSVNTNFKLKDMLRDICNSLYMTDMQVKVIRCFIITFNYASN